MRHIVFFIGIVFAICSCTKLEDPILGLTNRVEISTSTPVTAIGPDTAFAGGIIKTDGGESIIERGVVWSTSANPTISGKDRRKAGAGLGNFLVQIDTLIPFRDYFVRAYATNYYGTVYGQQVTFKTIKGRPRLGNSFSMSRDAYNIKLAGTLANDGGEPVESRGFCLSVNPLPTILLTGNNSQNRVVPVTTSASYFETTVGGLLPKTNYFIRSYATNRNGTSYGKQFQVTTEMGPPKIDPIVISNKEATSVRLRMKITSAEGGRIVRYGFAISSTNKSPLFSQEGSEVRLYENSLTRNMLSILSRDPSGSGTFEVDVKDLKAGTTYYVTGYAINESEDKINKNTHTDVQVFTTKGPPSVVNINSSGLSYYSFIANARILGDGESPIREMGFYVSTNPDPRINPRVFPVGVKLGDFSSLITSLDAGKFYYFTAFARNDFGLTIASNPVAVLTLANTKPVINRAPTPGVFIGKGIPVSAIIDSDGGLPISERGFYYSTNPNSFTFKESSSSIQGFPQGEYSNTISNNIVFGNVQYYVWAFARNAFGETIGQIRSTFTTPNKTTPIVRNDKVVPGARSATVNGIIDSDGFGTISSSGFLWANNASMSGATTISGSINLPNFSGTISGLSPNTNYWFQAFANNEIGRSTLPVVTSFKTLCEAAGVSYSSVSASTTSLLITYNLTSLGGDSNVTRGVCFSSTNTNPQLNGAGVSSSVGTQSTTGLFQASATGLISRRTYYAQAYATNCFGTVYYGVRTFTTL
jgi:hypothetical protein